MNKSIGFTLFLILKTALLSAQISWVSPIYNDDVNNSYFYYKNEICSNGNRELTVRSFFSNLDNTYHCNYQIHTSTGQLIIDSSYNDNQFFGVVAQNCMSFSNGFIIGLTYNPQTLFQSDVYQFIDMNGAPLFSVSNDSMGLLIDCKLKNDTIYSLVAEYDFRIKKFDLSGNFISYTTIDTNVTVNRFNPVSFVVTDSTYIVYGHKAISSFNSSYDVKEIGMSGNFIAEYNSNPTYGVDEIKELYATASDDLLLGISGVQNGGTAISFKKLDANCLQLWDTTLNYLASLKNVTSIISENGKYYFGITGYDSITNLSKGRIFEYDVNSNSMSVMFEMDSLISSTDFSLESYQNGLIVEGRVLNGTNQNFDFYSLSQNGNLQFASYHDTSFSTNSYFLIDVNSIYFGGSRFVAKIDLVPLALKNIADKESPFIIYPNPCSGIINLKIEKSNLMNAEFQLINSSGQVVMYSRFTPEKIDFTLLENGLYSVRLFNNLFSHIESIIVSH